MVRSKADNAGSAGPWLPSSSTIATAAGGAIADPTVLIYLFVALNLVAAAVCLLGARSAAVAG